MPLGWDQFPLDPEKANDLVLEDQKCKVKRASN